MRFTSGPINLGKLAALLSSAGQIDTGTVATPLPADVQEIDGDTGAANQLETTFANGFNDTGINDRLATIQNKTDSLTFSQAGIVDANVQYVNDREVEGTGEANDPWGPV